MPWVRIDDVLPFDPKVLTAGRNRREVNETLGAAARLWAWCGQQRTDGFMPGALVDMIADKACIDRLRRPTAGRAPWMHHRDDHTRCRCLAGRHWPDGMDYLVHDFLDRNPSRQENDVAKAKRAELRDRELRADIRRRDRDMCRYCTVEVNWSDRRSGRGGVLDHVDPTIAAGAANLVTSCRSCNGRKGSRTPEAAGMTLLPPPPEHLSAEQAYQLADRALTDADQRQDLQPICDGSIENSQVRHRSDHRSVSEPTTDPAADPPADRAPETADLPPQTSGETTAQRTDGTGRDGPGPGQRQVGPPDTPRTSVNPNPYLRAAVTGPAPDDHAGYPRERASP